MGKRYSRETQTRNTNGQSISLVIKMQIKTRDTFSPVWNWQGF